MLFETTTCPIGRTVYHYEDGPHTAQLIRLEDGTLVPGYVVAGENMKISEVIASASAYIRASLLHDVA